jgi:hypothetical protein
MLHRATTTLRPSTDANSVYAPSSNYDAPPVSCCRLRRHDQDDHLRAQRLTQDTRRAHRQDQDVDRHARRLARSGDTFVTPACYDRTADIAGNIVTLAHAPCICSDCTAGTKASPSTSHTHHASAASELQTSKVMRRVKGGTGYVSYHNEKRNEGVEGRRFSQLSRCIGLIQHLQ